MTDEFSQLNLSPLELYGKTLIGSDEEPIGEVTGFFGHQSDLPKWIAVTCADNRQHVVPFTGTQVGGSYVKAFYSSQYISDAATVASNRSISADEESRLYEHYGLHQVDDRLGIGSEALRTEPIPGGSPRFYSASPTGGAPFKDQQIGPERRPMGAPPKEEPRGPEKKKKKS
jgi:hypothetical protein